jgi:ABC-2 type transport system permease protein
MQVFKVYFKIIKKNLTQMLIYLIVFLSLAILLTNIGGSKTLTGFSETKNNIAFFNYDKNSQFTDGFRQYLSHNANIIDIADDTKSLQDALFFRKVVYIVKIPQGFTQSFFNGSNNVLIEKITVPGSASSVFMDFLINKYLSTASLYAKNLTGITETQLVSNLDSDLKLKVPVDVHSFGKKSDTSNVTYYFTYLAYTIMGILILGVTSIMLVFNDVDLKRRNLSSPINSMSMNIQLILGNFAFVLVVWAVMVAMSFLIYGKELLRQNMVLLSINSLVYAIVSLSISFLVGNLIKSRNAQSAIANVLTLGTCFIGGVFVPQQLLGKTVQSIASFTPTYWYVKAIGDINSLVQFNTTYVMPIIYCMLIQLGFAVAIFAISLVIVKQKRVNNG